MTPAGLDHESEEEENGLSQNLTSDYQGGENAENPGFAPLGTELAIICSRFDAYATRNDDIHLFVASGVCFADRNGRSYVGG
jgi:hypothetical protein